MDEDELPYLFSISTTKISLTHNSCHNNVAEWQMRTFSLTIDAPQDMKALHALCFLANYTFQTNFSGFCELSISREMTNPLENSDSVIFFSLSFYIGFQNLYEY